MSKDAEKSPSPNTEKSQSAYQTGKTTASKIEITLVVKKINDNLTRPLAISKDLFLRLVKVDYRTALRIIRRMTD